MFNQTRSIAGSGTGGPAYSGHHVRRGGTVDMVAHRLPVTSRRLTPLAEEIGS